MILSGIFNLRINGTLVTAGGSFTFNHGGIRNEAKISGDGKVAGFKSMGTVPFIEGELIYTPGIDSKALQAIQGGEIILELANGKVFVLINAHWAGDGNIQTEDGNYSVRFEGTDSEEFTA
ncbi:MAG: phage tail tube protein [Pseudobacteriovorax sp.]|nr:phage tail tube protein [Pseudobacteriovorax sp.]NRA68622.1 phage tail tube protein [Pseudobacteriovorax sp.]